MPEQCDGCAFYLPNTAPIPFGLCRRFPPQTETRIQDGYPVPSNYPLVSPTDWCGEWAKA